MTTTSLVPAEISHFFLSLYDQEPQREQERRNTIYSLPNQSIRISTDAHGGCHIDIKPVNPEIDSQARGAIEQLAEAFKQSKACNSLWVNFDLPCSPAQWGRVLPESFVIGVEGQGDLIQDVQQKKIRIWQWLNADKVCTIPPGATHNLGGSALIIDPLAKKILLVLNKNRNTVWNLPGGSFEPWKDVDPADTALREAQEEGGFELPHAIKEKPQLVGQMQFPENSFAPAINQIWAYFIAGISNLKLNPPTDEIKQAEWFDIKEIKKSDGKLGDLQLSNEVKQPLRTALKGHGFREISNKRWMIIHTHQ